MKKYIKNKQKIYKKQEKPKIYIRKCHKIVVDYFICRKQNKSKLKVFKILYTKNKKLKVFNILLISVIY